MSAHLVFRQAEIGGDFVFGSVSPAPAIVSLSTAASLAAAVVVSPLSSGATPIGASPELKSIATALSVAHVPQMGTSAVMPGAVGPAGMTYDNAVNRAPFVWAGARHGEASHLDLETEIDGSALLAAELKSIALHSPAEQHGMQVAERWQPMSPGARPPDVRLAHRLADPAIAEAAIAYQVLLPDIRPPTRLRWELGAACGLLLPSSWAVLAPRPRPEIDSVWAIAHGETKIASVPHHVGLHAPLGLRVPWGEGMPPPPGLRVWPPPPGPPSPFAGSAHLVFVDAYGQPAHLVFGRSALPPDIPTGIVIPTLRVYVMVNELSLVRVSGNLALPCQAFTLQIDASSWAAGWRATLPARLLDDVLPTPGQPLEILATINGHPLRLLAERVQRDRTFGRSTITISGRSLTAELGSPYCPPATWRNTSDITAQQALTGILTDNGVPIGWSIDWGITDWLLPPGAWSGTGTRIDAANRIASAAGAYIQPHASSRALRVLPLFPVPSWDLALQAPDVTIPISVATRESIDWQDLPPINRLFLAGEIGGILAQVTRAGTAGDRVGESIVDPLLTAEQVARQRGIAVLSRTGRVSNISLRMPILTGILWPGKIARFADGATSRTGLVRSVSIDARFPVATQTVGLECYE